MADLMGICSETKCYRKAFPADNIAVITKSVITGNTIPFQMSYPDGFNKDNCITIALTCGYKDITSKCDIEKQDNGINITRSETGISGVFKLVLIKIS